MPLDKNDPRLKKGGRKGYQYEEAQLKKMRRLLNKDLAIAEKLQNSKELDATDKEKLQILQARVLKYADKLHASRQTQEHSGEIILPTPILKNVIQRDNNPTKNTGT
jgi:hypothetical protein